MKKRTSWPLNPMAIDRRILTRRNLPISTKTAEMVQPHLVNQRKRTPQPLQPPGITAGLQSPPIVERIAPELASGAKVIGRYTRHHPRPSSFIELKQLAMRPD